MRATSLEFQWVFQRRQGSAAPSLLDSVVSVLLYGVGLITMLANRDFKRLGDLAAGTIVVHQSEKLAAKRELPTATP